MLNLHNNPQTPANNRTNNKNGQNACAGSVGRGDLLDNTRRCLGRARPRTGISFARAARIFCDWDVASVHQGSAKGRERGHLEAC